jgi:hypothetical protein
MLTHGRSKMSYCGGLDIEERPGYSYVSCHDLAPALRRGFFVGLASPLLDRVSELLPKPDEPKVVPMIPHKP